MQPQVLNLPQHMIGEPDEAPAPAAAGRRGKVVVLNLPEAMIGDEMQFIEREDEDDADEEVPEATLDTLPALGRPAPSASAVGAQGTSSVLHVGRHCSGYSHSMHSLLSPL